MQEDIRNQLKTAIADAESEMQHLGEVREQKRQELKQLRKALGAISPRQAPQKGKVLTITSGGRAKPNAGDSAS